MPASFDPYYKWLAIPPGEQPPNHYRLLGIKLFESDAEVIANAADARMAQVRTYRNGEHSAESEKLLGELTAARACLLNSEKRQAYHQKLKAAKPAAAPKTSLTGSPQASGQPKRAVPLPAAATVMPATVMPAAVDFDLVQETAGPSSRKTSQETKKKSMLLPLLVAGVGLTAGIATGALFLVMSGKPGSASPEVARAVNTNQPPEGQERPLQKSAESPAARVAESPAAVATSAPTPAPTVNTADSPSPAAAVSAAADKPVRESHQPDSEVAQGKVSAPTKEASPAADAPASEAGAGQLDVPEAADDRQPVPAAAARKEALDLIAEVYKEDYAKAKKPADKLALAEKLLKEAANEADAAQRFTLLSEARSLALAGGGPQLLAEVAHQLGAGFVIDENKVLADSLEKLAEKLSAKPVLSEMAEVALSHADEAAGNDQFEQATRLANLALSAAKKAAQAETIRNISARVSELNDLAKQFQAAREAETRLATDPNDPEAHLTLGKYLCFGKWDWEAGTPHLVKGNDPALQHLAQQESQPPADAAEQAKLADGWWDLAEASKGSVKLSYQRRAAAWYQQAQEKLSGLAKSRVDKRLQSLTDKPASTSAAPARKTTKTASRNAASKEVFLCDLEPLELFTHNKFKWRDPVVVDGVQSPHGLFLHPENASQPAHVAFKIGGIFRRFEGKVSLADTAERSAFPLVYSVRGDGNVLWRSAPLTSRKDGQNFQLNVTGVDWLELFVECGGNNTFAHAVWCEPRLNKSR